MRHCAQAAPSPATHRTTVPDQRDEIALVDDSDGLDHGRAKRAHGVPGSTTIRAVKLSGDLLCKDVVGPPFSDCRGLGGHQ